VELLVFLRETSHAELSVSLHALTDQIPAAVNDFGFHQSLLIFLAWSLNNFDKSIEELHTKLTGEAVDELFLIDGQHLSHKRDEIDSFLIDLPIWISLFTKIILEIRVVTLGQKLEESEKSHTLLELILSFN
jgi:hypothetical protein